MGKKTSLLASSKAVDPLLQALFASSSGPVSTPPSSRYQNLRENKPKSASNDQVSEDDEVLSEASEELNYEDDDDDDDDDNDNNDDENDESSAESSEEEKFDESDKKESSAAPRQERKRKRKDDNEDLEGKYFDSLNKNDDKEPSGKRVKGEATKDGSGSDNSDDSGEDEHADKDALPEHESLSKETNAAEVDKAARTVFLANVSAEAVSSKAAKKQLLAHLSAALDKDAYPLQKVESIRFRSVAFSAASMPKRAAYITKSVMEATTHSANAYAVLSTAAAARRVCQKLNGSEVLGRHLRVDNVAHPSPMDHRRCVFVGNLGFVDDETTLGGRPGKDGGEKEPKKRNKVPADVEEGLWRTFSKTGKVENVRVVRDPQTRVGKGFAYVQFYDANTVEEALLLDGKSFPPMLPRKLRVTRAKDPRRTNQAMERTKAKFNSSHKASERGSASGNPARKGASTYVPKLTPEQQAAAGRAGKLFGRARASGGAVLPGGIKAPEKVVFEGRRASSRDALPKDLKKKVKTKRARPTTRSARRGADWKKKSGK